MKTCVDNNTIAEFIPENLEEASPVTMRPDTGTNNRLHLEETRSSDLKRIDEYYTGKAEKRLTLEESYAYGLKKIDQIFAEHGDILRDPKKAREYYFQNIDKWSAER